MPKVTGVQLVVEGRTFVQEHPTFEQEMRIHELAVRAGLTDLKGLAFDPETDDIQKPLHEMIVRAYQSGVLFQLMASLVTEEGKDWTVDAANEWAELFRTTRDPESKKNLQPALVGAVVAFFESAAPSDLTSLISLEEAENESVRPKRTLLTEAQAEEAFRTGNMPSLSSPSVTPTDSTLPSSSAPGASATDSLPTKKSAKKKPGASTATL